MSEDQAGFALCGAIAVLVFCLILTGIITSHNSKLDCIEAAERTGEHPGHC